MKLLISVHYFHIIFDSDLYLTLVQKVLFFFHPVFFATKLYLVYVGKIKEKSQKSQKYPPKKNNGKEITNFHCLLKHLQLLIFPLKEFENRVKYGIVFCLPVVHLKYIYTK